MSIDDNSFVWSPNSVSCISDLLERFKTCEGYLYTKLMAHFHQGHRNHHCEPLQKNEEATMLIALHLAPCRYPNKFTDGFVISHDTLTAELDCFKIQVNLQLIKLIRNYISLDLNILNCPEQRWINIRAVIEVSQMKVASNKTFQWQFCKYARKKW